MSKRQSEIHVKDARASALASLEARSALVDDVDAALATNKLVVTVAGLQCLKRIFDLHRFSPFLDAHAGPTQKRAQGTPETGLAHN
jgi:hypothetical protein